MRSCQNISHCISKIAACLTLVAAGPVGCSRAADEYKTGAIETTTQDSEDQTPNQASEGQSPKQANKGQTAAGGQMIDLDGRGRRATEKFTLEPGLAMFAIHHDGDSNVVIKLLDRDGNVVDTLFNQIGTFEGQRGFAIAEAGQYLLDVAADGNWTVAIRQPRPNQGDSVPRTLEGTGFGTTEFIRLDKGLTVFKINHAGKGRFTVNLVDRDGHPVEQLVNALGKFEGSKPVKIEKPGIYFLNVGGDGDWTIDVE